MAEEVPIYWIGEDFEPSVGVDPLVLARVDLGKSSRLTRHLTYETPYGVPGFYIYLWTPAEWQAQMAAPQGQLLADRTCVTRLDIQVGGMDVALYFLEVHYPILTEPRTMSDECSLRTSTLDLSRYRMIAVIDFDDVIVDVRVGVSGHLRHFEDMEAYLLALKRR